MGTQQSGLLNKLYKNKEQPKRPDGKMFNRQVQEHLKHYEEQGYELIGTHPLL